MRIGSSEIYLGKFVHARQISLFLPGSLTALRETTGRLTSDGTAYFTGR
jgi:hypothetical protein